MPITVVVRSQGESPIEDHLTRMRSRHRIECVPDTKAADCIRALRRNRVLVLLIDRRHQGPGGICVPFFGQPARSTPGPARLALLTGAPVIACGSWRRPDGSIEGLAEPPLPLIRSGDNERDIWLNTAQHQAAIERLVRHAPEQWIWHRRRWRLRKREPGPLYAELTRPAA